LTHAGVLLGRGGVVIKG